MEEKELIGPMGIPAGFVDTIHRIIDIDDTVALPHPFDKFPHADQLPEPGTSRFTHNIGDGRILTTGVAMRGEFVYRSGIPAGAGIKPGKRRRNPGLFPDR
jgi:hypothetical protein